ncbi:MAG: XTP/dITP diphosphatase [Nitrospirota bacterium]|nr:XTP/dITP diphosphatase [Nitrospirota bacterium]MDP2384641.1 XTP/dITP diphosphatase [Nitrospirota bacterium]MDP3598043.1 XTP/dITP diphosphatase [Nitrospirota bacterium]
MIRELVLATRNRHKVMELVALLRDLGITTRSLDEFPDAPDVVEDGTTCEANAIKKARAIAEFTGLPAVADDTGLEVDALGGRPGVYAARYAGEDATYEDNCRKLLRELTGVPRERRTARFLTVAALALPSGEVQVAQGILDGTITEEASGALGFGYDPVFFVSELGKTLAQISADQKNTISHRAKAFTHMRDILKALNAECAVLSPCKDS